MNTYGIPYGCKEKWIRFTMISLYLLWLSPQADRCSLVAASQFLEIGFYAVNAP